MVLVEINSVLSNVLIRNPFYAKDDSKILSIPSHCFYETAILKNKNKKPLLTSEPANTSKRSCILCLKCDRSLFMAHRIPSHTQENIWSCSCGVSSSTMFGLGDIKITILVQHAQSRSSKENMKMTLNSFRNSKINRNSC